MTSARSCLERTPLVALLLFVLLAGTAQPLPAASRDHSPGAAVEQVEHRVRALRRAPRADAAEPAAHSERADAPRALPRWRDVSERGLPPPRAPDA